MITDPVQLEYRCNAINGYWTSLNLLKEMVAEEKLGHYIGKAEITKITWEKNAFVFQLNDHREFQVLKVNDCFVYVGQEQNEAWDETQITSLIQTLEHNHLAYPIVSIRKEGISWVVETRHEHWL